MPGEYVQGLQGSALGECMHGQSVLQDTAGKQLRSSSPGFDTTMLDCKASKKRGRGSDALSANLPRRQHRSIDVAVSRKQAEEAAEYVNFLSGLPHLTSVVKENRRPLLPPQQSGSTRKTLVLDLDHTLIRSTQHSLSKAKGNKEIFMTNDGSCTAFQRRPWLKNFLEEVCQLFEVVVFTAGSRSYAEPLLDILDPERKYFSHRLYRDACLRVPSQARSGMAFLMKDLTSLGRPLESLLIVDNTPTVFGYQVNNGIPIVSWYEDVHDRELQNILPFLKLLLDVRDVRPLIAQHSSLHRMVDEAVAKFPAAFPCAMPAPPAEAETAFVTDDPLGLDILADACIGLGCDEQLEPPVEKSPFKPLDPLMGLPDLALRPDSADLAHLSGRRAQAPAPAYPTAAQAQRILGQRSEAPALADMPAQMLAHMRPHTGAPDGDDAAAAPVELLCAEADQALQQLQGNNSNTGASPSWTSSSEDSASAPAGTQDEENSSIDSTIEGLFSGVPQDEQSMWLDEQIAEAELLRQLEDSDSPVEATAQLGLPMFPDLAHFDGGASSGSNTNSSGGHSSAPGAGAEAAMNSVGKDGSAKTGSKCIVMSLNSVASMPELDENYITPAGSPRKQAASAPPVLDMRCARSDSLASAGASRPACDPVMRSLPCNSSGSRLPTLNSLGSYALQCFMVPSDEDEPPVQPKMIPGLRSPQLLCA